MLLTNAKVLAEIVLECIKEHLENLIDRKSSFCFEFSYTDHISTWGFIF